MPTTAGKLRNDQALQAGMQENQPIYYPISQIHDFAEYIASLDAGALLHKVRVCIQALTKRKLILLPAKQRHWLRQQFRDAIQRTATCRSKSFFVAFATPTFIQFAMNGASSWRRTIQSFPGMRSSAV